MHLLVLFIKIHPSQLHGLTSSITREVACDRRASANSLRGNTDCVVCINGAGFLVKQYCFASIMHERARVKEHRLIELPTLRHDDDIAPFGVSCAQGGPVRRLWHRLSLGNVIWRRAVLCLRGSQC